MGALEFGAGLSLARRRPLPPVFDFEAGTLPPGATLRRASAATCWAAGGALASLPADMARFERDPVGGTLRGLLLEPAATNLLPQSSGAAQFGETSGCAVTGGIAGAPDGGAGWARIAPNMGSGVFPYAADTSVPKAAGTTYTLSAVVRRETLRWVLLSGGLYGDARFAWFDLLAGAVGTIGGNATGATILAIDAATFRISVRFSGATNGYCLVAPVKADASFGADYQAGDTLLVWGTMLEAGAAMTSLVPTAGAAAARAADALTLDWGGRGIADGPVTVRYGFDDGSSQEVATAVAGGTANVPMNLNRRWLRRAELA